jgi:hypothetical protein
VRGERAAEARSGQQPVTDQEEVTFAFVAFGGGHQIRQAVSGEPGVVGRAFRGALRVGEAGRHGAVADDQSAVGGEHHVGQTRDAGHHLHGVSVFGVGGAQRLPLREGQRAVDGLGGIHPGIDGVGDLEVIGTAHHEPARRRTAGGGLDREGGYRGQRNSRHERGFSADSTVEGLALRQK